MEDPAVPHHSRRGDKGRCLLHDASGSGLPGRRRHPSHRAKTVAAFVAATDGRLRLFFLPGYAPELNPDEWVWKNIKHDRIGKIGVTNKDDLKTKTTHALRRLQKLPALVRGFFHDPNLAYISA
ncbi:MAG TPA: transposase [Mycobacterium sp.]|nr:transposase [Mycobacterium sp.]